MRSIKHTQWKSWFTVVVALVVAITIDNSNIHCTKWGSSIVTQHLCSQQHFFFAEAVATADDADVTSKNQDDTRSYTSAKRYPPCLDMHPHCGQWALLGECRKKASQTYMHDNCRLACNYCNPLIQQTNIELDMESLDEEFLEEDDEGNLIQPNFFHGVKQRDDFEDDVAVIYIDGTNGRKPSFSKFEVKQRLRHMLEAQEFYLKSYYSAGYWTLHLDQVPADNYVPIPETCINRHPYCAFWALNGFCESKPTSMSESCAPMCHFCEHSVTSESDVIYYPRDPSGSWHSTPLWRKDLHGIMEAIIDERIVTEVDQKVLTSLPHSWLETKPLKNGEGKVNMLSPKNMKVMPYLLGKTNQTYTKDASGNEIPAHYKVAVNSTVSDGQYLLVMDSFLSSDECRSLLDTIGFGVGVDTSRGLIGEGEDGFPPASTDVHENDNQQQQHTSRKSSRVYLNPNLKDDENGKTTFSPAVKRLLTKVALMTGIDAAEHIESPIKVDKFDVGDFQEAVGHFDDALVLDEGSLFVGREFHHTIDGLKQVFKKKAPSESRKKNFDSKRNPLPQHMTNARVLGMTIFLNDVEEGGELTFPKVVDGSGTFSVKPLQGRAVLFPTVKTLVGTPNEIAKPIDVHLYNMNEESDETSIPEDLGTVIAHETVESGTKYSVTIYLRRYADEDTNDSDTDVDDEI